MPVGETTQTMSDGSIVTYDQDGEVIRQTTPEGTVFDRFDASDRAEHAILPNHAGTAEITYQGDTSTWTYSDGNKIVRESDGDVLLQQTPDGTVFDRFAPDHRPTHATLPNHAGTADISYQGDDSTWSYSDGTEVIRDGDGSVEHMRTPEGADFDRFTDDGRPVHGTVPSGDGGPAQEVNISYSGDASTWSYADGTVVDRGADGRISHLHTKEGDEFDRFTADDKPTHGAVRAEDGQSRQDVTIEYTADGSVWTYSGVDGEVRVYRNGKDEVVRQELTDGTVYDAFNGNGDPVHGRVPPKDGAPGQEISVEYTADGSVWTYSSVDGEVHVYRNGKDEVVRQELTDGTVYDAFNGNGDPTHGHNPGADGKPGSTIDVTYNAEGSVWTYVEDGTGNTTVVHRNTENAPTRMESGGWTFTEFDGDRPTGGTKPGQNGAPPETVSVEYNANGSVWTYDDGKGNLTVITKNNHDQTVLMTSDGWTFDKFDGDQPLRGSKTGDDGKTQTVAITYNSDGSVWTYISDGDTTVVYRDPANKTVKMLQAGWTYTQFDADGNPTYGTKNGQKVRIDYGNKYITHSTFTDPDGHWTVVGTDKKGRPIFEIVDGIPVAYAVEIPRLLRASQVVRRRQLEIEGFVREAEKELETIGLAWDSPAGHQYGVKKQDVLKVTNQLNEVLDNSVAAMRKSYDHYLAAEGGNLANLTPATNSPVFNAWNAAYTAGLIKRATEGSRSI